MSHDVYVDDGNAMRSECPECGGGLRPAQSYHGEMKMSCGSCGWKGT